MEGDDIFKDNPEGVEHIYSVRDAHFLDENYLPDEDGNKDEDISLFEDDNNVVDRLADEMLVPCEDLVELVTPISACVGMCVVKRKVHHYILFMVK